jgi:hypothetical protein
MHFQLSSILSFAAVSALLVSAAPTSITTPSLPVLGMRKSATNPNATHPHTNLVKRQTTTCSYNYEINISDAQ